MKLYLKEFNDDFNVSNLPFKKHVISKKEILNLKHPEEINESWVLNVDLKTVDNDDASNLGDQAYFLNKTSKLEEQSYLLTNQHNSRQIQLLLQENNSLRIEKEHLKSALN